MAELKEGLVGGAMNLYFIYKFLRILTTPWEKTEAFKLGIVDDDGKNTIWKIPPGLLCCRPMVDQRRKILSR